MLKKKEGLSKLQLRKPLNLNIEMKNAEIEVFDEGSKRLFGLLGGRNAVVRVYKKKILKKS